MPRIRDLELGEPIEESREEAEERNFTQTVDLSVNFRNIDFSDPENRFTEDVPLPNGRGKAGNVLVIADKMESQAQRTGADVLTEDEMEDLDEDEARDLLEYDQILAEGPLMVAIGEKLGPVLAPAGKMPEPFDPGDDMEELVESASKTVSLSPKGNVLHTVAGTEDMANSELEENVRSILETVERNLPKGAQQMDSVYIKLTMGPSIRVM